MAQLPFVGTPVVGPDDFPFIGMPDFLENKGNKGEPNGYAPLDANSKVPTANLPDQASLDAEVDGKITTHNSATTSVHGIANTANLVLTNDARLSDTRDPKAHTHTKSNITDFAHTHAISDVTNLQSKLDTKQEYYYTPVTYSSDYTIQSTLSDTGSIERHFHFTVSGTPTYNPTTDSGIYINFPTTGKMGDIITITNSPLKIDGFANNVALLLRERSGTTNSNFGSLAVGTTQSYVRKSSNSGFGNWTYLAPTVHTHAIADVTGLQTALDGKALSSHTHSISNVTGLQTELDGKQASGSYAPATGIAPSAITGTAVITTDSRLSDSRVPTSHTHGNITNAGAVGSTANLPLITTTSGAITTGSFGTTANTFCEGNDSRISGIAGNKINIGVYGGSISSDGYGGSINTGGYGGSISTDNYGGTLDLSDHGGSITTGPYGGSINTTGQGSIGLGTLVSMGGGATGQTTILGSASGTDKTITLPNATGTVALTSDSRFTDSRTPTAHTHAISQVTNLQATLTAFAIALG